MFYPNKVNDKKVVVAFLLLALISFIGFFVVEFFPHSGL